MKYIDNDMDDLFNKAGQNYPLNTAPKNWEAVQKALLDQQVMNGNAKRKNIFRRYSPWLLLLLLLPVFYMINKPGVTGSRNEDNNENIVAGNLTADKNEVSKGPAEKEANNIPGSTDRKTNRIKAVKESEQTGIVKNTTAPTPDKPVTNSELFFQNGKTNKSVVINHQGKMTKVRKTYSPPDVKGKDGEQEEELSSQKRGSPYPPLAGTNHSGSLKDRNNGFSEGAEAVPELNGWITFPPLASMNQRGPSGVITASPAIKSYESTDKNEKPKITKTTSRFVYYGIIAGPDLSTIKGQEIRKAGYNVGLLAGYHFSKHLSFEAGAVWSKKKYYTDGKHFDKYNAGFSAGTNLFYLDGGCEMFEFPVSLRYDFNIGKNSFFATAGFTSQIMNTESYDYEATYPYDPVVYKHFKKYKNSGNDFFSGLHLSAGYNYKLSSKINIRVEPYLQIPLKKIGIGEMPITSTGLYIGLMKGH